MNTRALGRAGRPPPQSPGVRTPGQPCAALDWMMAVACVTREAVCSCSARAATMMPAAQPGARPFTARLRALKSAVVWSGYAAAGDQPGDDGVGVPHIAGLELVAAPHRPRYLGGQSQDAHSMVRVGAEALRTLDRFDEIRDAAVAPAADLVTEQPKPSRAAHPDRALGNNTAFRSALVPHGSISITYRSAPSVTSSAEWYRSHGRRCCLRAETASNARPFSRTQ